MKQTRRFQMKRVTFKMLVCVLVIWALTSVTFAQLAEVQCHKTHDLKKKLRTYFENLAEQRLFSGTVLIAREDKIILKDSFGFANYETSKPNTPSTVYAIASMGKAFTIMSIMMLEERGLLSVNDTIDKYIPGFPNGDLITLHHLMTHTSGLFRFINDPSSLLWQNGNISKFHTPEELLDYFMYYPLSFAPGTQWEYCNSGFIVLGIIIERVSGMTYRDFIKVNIFNPLKMKHTSYDPYEMDFINRKATGYDYITTDPPILTLDFSDSIAFSAGGIYSTVSDLYKWDQALYTEKLVSMETLERIFTPGLGDYGYGWWIDTLEINGQNHKQIWHWGSYFGFHSLISRLVDDKVTIIFLQNTSAPNDTFDDQEVIRDAVYHIIFNPMAKAEEVKALSINKMTRQNKNLSRDFRVLQ